MIKTGTVKALVGMGLFATALMARAVPITGEIGMFGGFKAVDSGWVETSTAAATGIDFNPQEFFVTNATGDFSGAGSSGFGIIQDFQFAPDLGVRSYMGVADPLGSEVLVVSSIVDFWTVGIFSFELTTVTKGATNNPDSNLILEGTGIISAAGKDDTMGTWIFTGNTSGGSFSWSAGSAAVVAEPGMLVILGIGLVGFAGHSMARRRKILAKNIRVRGQF